MSVRIIAIGVFAGTVATVFQILVWWLTDMPLLETLFRDTRFAAAILLGPDVVEPSLLAMQPSYTIFLFATIVHFGLSIACATTFALMLYYLPELPRPAYFGVGCAFGLALYLVNLYGLTVIWPWFAAARDLPTLLAHLVFGLALAVVEPNPTRRGLIDNYSL